MVGWCSLFRPANGSNPSSTNPPDVFQLVPARVSDIMFVQSTLKALSVYSNKLIKMLTLSQKGSFGGNTNIILYNNYYMLYNSTH